METFDVVVIGGGPAGVTAALRASELGATVALVERERLGGTCTNDGCVPTRVLARAARLARDTEQLPNYGLVGEPPIVNLSQLLARAGHIVYQIHEKKQLLQHLARSGVTVHANVGKARFIDPHTLALAEGAQLAGDKFILCVGGHARRLNFPGSERVLAHCDVWSLNRLPRSVVVIGAAATGCQLASIFAAFGSKVWLLDIAPRVLPAEDEHVSRAIAAAFAQRGMHVVTGIGGVERVEPRMGELRVYYTQDGQSLAMEAAAVVSAVGWEGNVDPLNPAAAGVRSEQSFIAVDHHLRTSVPHIFAAGDITGRMMLVQSASDQARVAAENAVLGVGRRSGHPIVPHGGFTDPEYGSVGFTEREAKAEGEIVTAVVPYAELDRAVIDDHTEGFCKLIVSQETHRILGAHVVGEQALEIVHTVAAGMAADMWVEQLAELEIAYPTYTAILGLAARQLVRQLGVVPLAPQWRALGRPPAAEWERSDGRDR